mmetsp:Transcript_20835/g.34368  ORF Transcript_20835/g.34368 Transcript_20835/m.34368 type:complete len:133 (+) Transcript_20835:94-492(+)
MLSQLLPSPLEPTLYPDQAEARPRNEHNQSNIGTRPYNIQELATISALGQWVAPCRPTIPRNSTFELDNLERGTLADGDQSYGEIGQLGGGINVAARGIAAIANAKHTSARVAEQAWQEVQAFMKNESPLPR